MKAPPAIIITTAHRDYAVEGYQFDVVDYLLKPITFTRFATAVEKFYQRRRTENVLIEDRPDTSERLLHLKVGTKVHQLNEKSILYVESIRDYIQIHFLDGKKMMLKYQIGKLETVLSKQFMRVHKSFIVNKWKITAFNVTQIELEKQSIPVGLNYKAAVAAYFKDSSPK
ncbi:MAG: DNA-binding response regulator [Cytophagia bacterium]|nr:DNA-binding response regulator [Cytophagia bacterium]